MDTMAKGGEMTAVEILAALRAFVEQRPGFDPANYYGAPGAYRADARRAQQQRRDALVMIGALETCAEYDGADIGDRLRDVLTRGSRLTLKDGRLDYCVGQYWPTEYRAGVCRAVSAVLWARQADSMTDPTGDSVRASMRRNFGRGIASRWFR